MASPEEGIRADEYGTLVLGALQVFVTGLTREEEEGTASLHFQI
jgi:hypothetical protein